jgi:hypothetical protein
MFVEEFEKTANVEKKKKEDLKKVFNKKRESGAPQRTPYGLGGESGMGDFDSIPGVGGP